MLPEFRHQSSSRIFLSSEAEQARNTVHGYGGEVPYLDPVAYESGYEDSSSPPCRYSRIRQRGSYILTNIVTLVHPTEVPCVTRHSVKDAYSGSTYVCPLYALSVPTYWVFPVVTQTIIPSSPVAHLAPSSPVAHVGPSSSAPASAPATQLTQVPTDGRRPGARTQKEEDLMQLEQSIISSLWYATNALEPPCGNPDCPHLADRYGIRGMSCYTAFVGAKPNGDFGCWREECSTYSTRRLEDAVKHQRKNHFNHKPFLCVPANGTTWWVSSLAVSQPWSSCSNCFSQYKAILFSHGPPQSPTPLPLNWLERV